MRKRRGEAHVCLAHIYNIGLYNHLREREIARGEPDKFRLEFFNVFESGARILLNEYPILTPAGADGSEAPRIAVIGCGWMGESLIVNAAHAWKEAGTGNRLKITVIDKDAGTSRLLCLSDTPTEKSCEIVTEQISVESPTSNEWLFCSTRTERSISVESIYAWTTMCRLSMQP